MNDCKLQMQFVEDGEKAFSVLRKNKTTVWVPRSLVAYRRKFPNLGKTWIEFSLPKWAVDEKELDDYVI